MVYHSIAQHQLISASTASCKLNVGGQYSEKALGVIRHNNVWALEAQAVRAEAFILLVALSLVT